MKFFCENCGGRVKARDRICPHCGRFFSKVRCPVCSFQGTADRFVMGCPQCGYMGFSAEGGKSPETPVNKLNNPSQEEVIDSPADTFIFQDTPEQGLRRKRIRRGIFGVSIALGLALLFLIVALISWVSM